MCPLTFIPCLIPLSPPSTVKTAKRHRSVYGRQNAALQNIISRDLHTLLGTKPHQNSYSAACQREMNKESTSPAVVPHGTGPSETTTAAIASDAATPANPSDAATSEVPLGSLTPVPRVPAVHPPTEYFNVDPSLQRQSSKGRGTRAMEFHEEFGYEAVVSGSNVAGEVFALPTMLPDTVAMNAT
jgi:hypothetical protein